MDALGDSNQLKEQLKKLEQELAALQRKLQEFIRSTLNQNTGKLYADPMPEIGGADNSLITKSAYLGFVKPSSRLNIMESCEGNLILSFFDLDGIMRQRIFDATADSRNTGFEQWQSRMMSHCLDFSDDKDAIVTLNTPISLGDNWTMECWFSYPLNYSNQADHQNDEAMVLISGSSGNRLSSPAMVLRQSIIQEDESRLVLEELGVYFSEEMNWIKDVINRLEDESTAIKSKGIITEDVVKKLEKLRQEINLLKYTNNQFSSSGFDMKQLSHGWHHLTVSGNGLKEKGTVTFYIDGLKVGEDTRTRMFSRISNLTKKDLSDFSFNYSDRIKGIGFTYLSQYPEGIIKAVYPTKPITISSLSKIAEIRFWDVALSPLEIEVNSRSYLSGNEPGLKAYYPLHEGKGERIRNYAKYYSADTDLNALRKKATWHISTAPIGHPGDHAMHFDGQSDYLKFQERIQLGNSCTFSCWFKSQNIKKEGLLGNIYELFNFDTQKSGNVQRAFNVTIIDANLSISYPALDINDMMTYALGSVTDNTWHHLSIVIENGILKVIFDGRVIREKGKPNSYNRVLTSWPISSEGGLLTIAGRPDKKSFLHGEMADFQIWNRALTIEESQQFRYRRKIGNETGLLLYCPLDEVIEEGDKRIALNFQSDNHGETHQTLSHQMKVVYTNDLPIGLDAVVVNEYPTVAFDPEKNQQTAMMWRFLATPKVDKIHLLTDKRIELLEYIWIGNGQFDPTLLGFIEGAPPVPSENLTVDDDYSDATSVALSIGQNTEYSWERTQDIFTEIDLSAKIGAGATFSYGGGLGVMAFTDAEFKVLGGLSANFKYGMQNSSNIAASKGLSLNDSLSLRGYKEEHPSIETVGSRFLPKNIGYALVISSMADIFVVRLKRSKKMVSYKILPLEGIPPQVNTITFMINPAYSLNGSLDGQVGTTAADKRFYKHVTEMRAQYGSKYPASYLRLDQAIDLQSRIDQIDKERESYFINFNSRLVDETSLHNDLETNSISQNTSLADRSSEPSSDDAKHVEDSAEDMEAEAEKSKAKSEGAIDKYQAMAESGAQQAGLFAWQTKMEKLLIKAGKQNIVNSYVWDADGGLHISSESFANSITHSIGGSFSFSGAYSLEMEVAAGIAVELSAAAGVGVELTMSKSVSSSKEVSLEVDLSGMEFRDITDHKDRPLMPGEKVDRYRFSSFFLEGNTTHFRDFFNYVVDPEWLASNDEEARALRSINQDKPNKTWRILHRVTYVERPALMGFGRETRPLLSNESDNDLTDQINKIDGNIKDIERNTAQLKLKIASLEEALLLAKEQNDSMASKLELILSTLKKNENMA